MLSKVFSQLLLPPAGLILLAGVGLLFWRKYWAKFLVGLVLVLFWLLSIEPVRDMLSMSLEAQYPPLNIALLAMEDRHENAVIVVLGAGIRDNSPEYQGRDELSRFAMMRTTYGADIAKQTRLDIYVSGGTPLRDEAEAEGNIMRRWLLWFGVDEERIYSETQANTTWENALLTKVLLAKKGVDTVVLVTSAWHMPRAAWCFSAQGLRVIAAPTDYLTSGKGYDLRSFLPKASTFSDSAHVFHEYLGLAWYRLKFTI